MLAKADASATLANFTNINSMSYSLIKLEGGWLLVSNVGHFFMIFGYFMIYFLVSFKKNEIITGLSVFLSVKRRGLPCVVADDDDV